ncbi:hypothetical protein [Cellulophaga baltica]|uniref:HmuY protein n=1 Tax=Cellulophaga baltica TaxID=76594 RepID=A0A1G7LAE3_9FLAO|nr:hypothetical protein [Cellulophaga baltica]SDF46000.1 hypothetical protein SAMN04487992_11649 [Cellulophaga baltica]
MKKKYYLSALVVCLLFNLSSCSSDGDTSVDPETEEVDENATDDPTDEEVSPETPDPETPDPDPEPTDPEEVLDCLKTFGTNYVVFEAEATESPLDQWELISKGDAGYLDKESLGPINETHLEFTGNNQGSGPATSPLEYVFTAPSTGAYKLVMRLYQRLEGAEEDKSNDVYIRMAGNFTTATDKYTTEDLETDLKFFGRGVDQWGGVYSGDGGAAHNKSAILYNLIEGEEYTFTMSGRSKNANIDYILFYDTKDITIQTGANKDIAELNDAQYRPDWDCNQ